MITHTGMTCPSRFYGEDGLDEWRPGAERWKTPLGRWLEQQWHHGFIGQRIKALKEWTLQRHRRVSGALGPFHVTGRMTIWLRLHLALPSLYASGGTYWPSVVAEPPRTCSYCGSAHYEDVMDLIQLGWVISPARGKAYINPPGHTPGPIPPVKLYMAHLSRDQVEEMNALLSSQRAREGKLTARTA